MAYATFDPTNKGSAITLSNGNLTETASAVGEVRANAVVVTGTKHYWEVTAGTQTPNTAATIGIDDGSGNLNNYTGHDVHAWGYYTQGGVLNNAGFVGSGAAAYTTGDIIGIALDLVGNTLQFYKNGTITGTALTVLSSTNYYPACGSGANGCPTTANFGATAFAYSPPAGFTGGITVPGIIQVNDVYAEVIGTLSTTGARVQVNDIYLEVLGTVQPVPIPPIICVLY